MEDAGVPTVLPDGSLLVDRVDAEGKLQIHRFWPETGRLEALGAELTNVFNNRLGVFPDGRETVFFGRPLSSARPEPPMHYYILDLISGGTRPLAPELRVSLGFVKGALAIASGSQSVMVATASGDLSRVVEVPRSGHRSGNSPARTLLSLEDPVWNLDAGPDGSIYVDQVQRPTEILRFPASGGVPEKQPGVTDQNLGIAPLPDGRALFLGSLSGRSRLVASRPGKDPLRFVQTEEETGAPFTVLGEREVAFELGMSPNQMLAVASASDGRMIRRLPATKGLDIGSLASSPDGNTLYYTVSGTVWAIPAVGGEPRKVAAGNEVVADPNGRDLVVNRYERDGYRLVRISLAGGAESAIPFQSEFRFKGGLSPNAVRSDGRILVYIQAVDSWWDEVGILDPKTGKVEKLNIPYAGDIDCAGWTRDGRILAQGFPMQASLWRFHKEAKP